MNAGERSVLLAGSPPENLAPTQAVGVTGELGIERAAKRTFPGSQDRSAPIFKHSSEVQDLTPFMWKCFFILSIF